MDNDFIYLSTNKTTGGIEVNKNKIILKSPPIWKIFIGQNVYKLIDWLYKKDKNLIAKKIK